MGVLLTVILAQIIVITIIVIILKTTLDRRLMEMAIRQLALLKNEKEIDRVNIVSHLLLAKKYRDQMTQIIKKQFGDAAMVDFLVDVKIWGGLVIKSGEKIIDCSLKNRLQQAFGGKS